MSDLYTLPSNLSVATQVAELLREVQVRYRNGVPSGNRRKNRRFPFNDPVIVHRANRHATELGSPQIATGHDISLWGLSMLAPERYKLDSYLVVGFHLNRAGTEHVVRMLATVRHLEERLTGDWLVGCEFCETLTEMST